MMKTWVSAFALTSRRLRRIVLLSASMLTLSHLAVSAQQYRLEGTVGDKYPIVMELTKHDDGFVTGRYAYKSTLAKSGDNPCSWLEIHPYHEDPHTMWITRDCNLQPQEDWWNVRFNGTSLSARMKTAKGKVYDISAKVVSSKAAPDDLTEHFRDNLGKYPFDFAMFSDPYISGRLETMMGADSFNYMASIFQTQSPVEYREGMFWSSGFVAHECCDPAVVWAYDTRNKSFYVWIRKDGIDYWWSETGHVPYEFKELVSANF